MSVIGPRPQLVRDMTFMTKEQRMRHTAKPGLSGLAQVNGRNAITWEDKLEWDKKYIRKVGFKEDVRIILETVKKAFIKQEGISQDNMATAEDFGDYLLKNKKITSEEYDKKQIEATPIILYEYQRTRKADHPEEFLKDFKGIVVCDGYSAYRKLDRENPDIVFAGCWSHARRRFAEALKALPKAAQKNAKETVAYEAVSRIAAIYHLDNQMEGQPAKVRKMYRQANIRPLVEAFFAWAKEIQTKNQLSRGKTLDGINYCINQEVSLKAFLEDGDIPMDNNATESALRSFCLHKHTWKLIDSLDGANASAIIYSITETAKANNLNPFRYLEHVLTVLKDHQDDREYSFIDDILPWSEKLPAICRSKTKATNI